MTNPLSKLALFTPLLIVIAATNYVVDPGQLFRGEAYVQRIVDLLADGRNVWNINPNHNERTKQKLMVAKFTSAPEVMVLGSSRSKAIGKATLPGKDVYNAGVSAGTLEEFIAIYEMFHARGLTPREVILELSAWLLNKDNDLVHGHFATLMPEYGTAVRRMEGSFNAGVSLVRWIELNPLRQLLSPSYLHQSLGGVPGLIAVGRRVLTGGSRNEARPGPATEPRTTEVPIKDTFVLVADGTWWSSEEDRVTPLAEAIQHAEYPKGLFRFTELDAERNAIFENFIQRMQADGVKVTLFIPPWPNESYRLIKPRYPIVDGLERYFGDVARRYGLDVYGSYDAAELGLKLADFTDSEHLRRPAVKEIFQNRLKGQR